MDWNKFEESLSRREFSYYQIERLKKLEEFLEKHDSCEYCRNSKKELGVIYNNIDKLKYNLDLEKKHEKFIDDSLTHMKKKHGIYSVFYFVSLYSFYGLFAGIVLTGITQLAGLPLKLSIALLMISMFVGYIIGNSKDRKLRFTNRIL